MILKKSIGIDITNIPLKTLYNLSVTYNGILDIKKNKLFIIEIFQRL